MKPTAEHFLATAIEAASTLPVRTVFRRECNRVGWPEHVLDQWEQAPIEGVAGLGWQAVVYRTGLDIADRVESEDELAYHNRTHTAEVLTALGALILQEYTEGTLLLRSEGLKLMTAMVAHDVDYATTPWDAEPGVAEAHSAEVLAQAFRRFPTRSNLEGVCDELVAIVLATNPLKSGEVSRRLQESPLDLARRREALAVEADLLPSLLPTLGVARGLRLSNEWAQRGNPNAKQVATPQGRQAFLRTLHLDSQAAQALGLRQLRDNQLP